jgi:hypothetical protein
MCSVSRRRYTHFAGFKTLGNSMGLIFRVAGYVFLLTIGTYALAAEKSEESVLELLVTAKFSGGCGVITQMASFQQSTKMPGGDEFLGRFLNTESARLGMTVKQYLEQCRQSTQMYQTYYDEFEKASAASPR